MKQIKIFLTESNYDEYNDTSLAVICDSITDWETISDDDYTILTSNLWRLQSKYGERLRILEKDSVPVIDRIADIKSWIQEEKTRAANEAAKKKAIQDKKARDKMLKKADNEIKLLEELRQKYPDA